VEPEGEGVAENEGGEPAAGEEPRAPLAPLPQTVFHLVAEEEFILKRISELPQEQV